jgi:hypothetical protein
MKSHCNSCPRRTAGATLDAEARGAAQARAEPERRAAQRARSLAARAAELPALEREEAAEREAWIGANLMRPERTR